MKEDVTGVAQLWKGRRTNKTKETECGVGVFLVDYPVHLA